MVFLGQSTYIFPGCYGPWRITADHQTKPNLSICPSLVLGGGNSNQGLAKPSDTRLEPDAAEIIKPLVDKGPVVACCDNDLYINRRELAHAMRIKLPENCLRNSYAALIFRSIGEVAKAMGDPESTVKRFYVQTLEPGVTTDEPRNKTPLGSTESSRYTKLLLGDIYP